MNEKANIGSQEPTLEEQVNTALATADDNGKIAFEEGVDPIFKQLVLTEKRSRGHQAKAIERHQENTALLATNEVLNGQLTQGNQLTAEQTDELEDLKFTDSDAYFTKRTQYEKEAAVTVAGKLKELTDTASAKAVADLTLSERKDVLADFESSTGIKLTDDVMQNDVPPRLQAKINSLPFSDYLQEVASYLSKTKVVKPTDDGIDQTNLEKLNGGNNGGQGGDYVTQVAKLSPDGIL